MYIIVRVYLICQLTVLNSKICNCLSLKNKYNNINKLKNNKNDYFFVNFQNSISHINQYKNDLENFNNNNNTKQFEHLKNKLNLVETEVADLEDDVTRILYGIENPQDIRGPYISPDGKIINKKKKLYSTGELCHVDDFYEGKFKVEWTVRGVKEKLQYRYRDIHTLPLTTSRFTLAGIKGFVLRLWLDGHKGSKKGHIALSLVQQEHWTTLDSPICLFAGNIVKGPFFYRSPEYISCSKSFCRLEDVLENNTIKLGVMIAKRDDMSTNKSV